MKYDSSSTTDVAMTIANAHCDHGAAHLSEVHTLLKRKDELMGEISSDVIRGYNDTIILFLLLDSPSYGYEISKKIKSISEEKYLIKETTLYSAFTRMEKNGYIESYSQNSESGKKRTYYRITDSGRSYYREKCEEWNLTKEVIEHFITEGGENGNS